MKSDVMTTEEAARYLKISARSLRRLVQEGKIVPFLMASDRTHRFRREDLVTPKPKKKK